MLDRKEIPENRDLLELQECRESLAKMEQRGFLVPPELQGPKDRQVMLVLLDPGESLEPLEESGLRDHPDLPDCLADKALMASPENLEHLDSPESTRLIALVLPERTSSSLATRALWVQ